MTGRSAAPAEVSPRQALALRGIYALQLVACPIGLGCLFAVWWRGLTSFTFWDLLSRIWAQLAARSPDLLGQPLLPLVLLLPAIPVFALRGMAGVLIVPVAYARLAIAALLAAGFALAHFYIAFRNGAPADSPLTGGSLGSGYWLTVGMTGVLALLAIAELLIRPRRARFEPRPRVHGQVDDPERLLRGDYRPCPYCGTANEPAARRCFRCNILLFEPSEVNPDPR